ncbi:MazG nucleotide pyrophosphohydrolase [Alkaliphilus metalliredigens QYMF]|uniref:MazG nucleotide pyrophosphohydrolase n=1 Tax=Alkaliphilus metalliredigens (strain QYMF) TaxID=293826 RepID=A6TMV2_ALKMQ|nr:MazG-like family protein [Alkaliphilus metalliredigens]ABR47520.1 MazG nucleotide pyrophosphohydrolase [Alkaliphilus metalliredigens QYMF]
MKNTINLKTISLPQLNGLCPTLESTALKIAEENGELCRAIGKFRGLSGERDTLETQEAFKEVAKELLDVAQTSFTMMFLLEKEHGIDIESYIEEHIEKLIKKGYINTGLAEEESACKLEGLPKKLREE